MPKCVSRLKGGFNSSRSNLSEPKHRRKRESSPLNIIWSNSLVCHPTLSKISVHLENVIDKKKIERKIKQLKKRIHNEGSNEDMELELFERRVELNYVLV